MEQSNQQIQLKGKEDSEWNEYLDQQLKHLVIEWHFNFEQISKLLVTSDSNSVLNVKKFSKKELQKRWCYLHQIRKKLSTQTDEELYFEKIAHSIITFTDPKKNLTLQQILQKLPTTRIYKDNLLVKQEDLLQQNISEENNSKQKPSTFNILKDSVRGIKDVKQRTQVQKKNEEEFFKTLHLISTEQDAQMQEKPYFFKAVFTSQNDFIVERTEMTKQALQKKLAQKIDYENLASHLPPEAESIEIDNFVSKFAVQSQNESSVLVKNNATQQQSTQADLQKQEQSETDNQTDQEQKKKKGQHNEDLLAKMQPIQDDDQHFEEKLNLVNKGVITLDDAIKDFEYMKQQSQLEIQDKSNNLKRNVEEQSQHQQQAVPLEKMPTIQNIKENPEKLQEKQPLIAGDVKLEQIADVQKTLKNEGTQNTVENSSDAQISQVQQHNQLQQDGQSIESVESRPLNQSEIVVSSTSQILKEQVELAKQKYVELTQKKEGDEMAKDFKGNINDGGMRSESDLTDESESEQDFLDQKRKQQKEESNTSQEDSKLCSQKKKHTRKKKKIIQNQGEEQISLQDQFNLIDVQKHERYREKVQKFKEMTQYQKEKIEGELWDKQKPEEKFKGIIELKKNLEQDQSKRVELERQNDLSEIQKLEEKFKQKEDERKEIKKREKAKKKQELLLIQQEQMREQQRLRNEVESKLHQELELINQKLEQEKQQEQIKKKNLEFENYIKNFETNSFIGCLYDSQTINCDYVLGIPQWLSKQIEDFKSYDISRDAITNRFQILVFPYLEETDFNIEFLSFFLRNSFFKQESTQQQQQQQQHNLSQPDKNKLDDNVQGNSKEQGNFRISSSGFPFYLVSFFTCSICQNIKDQSDMFISSYLLEKEKKILMNEIIQSQCKRYIYLLFDTYIGKGKNILSERLELTLGQIIDPKTLKKAQKKHYEEYEINEKTPLNSFCLGLNKSMELTNRIFTQTTTFHGISPSPSEEGQFTHFEKFVVIVRSYGEILLQQPSKQLSEDKTAVTSENLSDLGSQTEQSLAGTQESFSIIATFLKLLQKKRMQVLGLKSFFLSNENQTFLQNNFDRIKIDNKSNKPFIAIVVGGVNLQQRLKKIIGSDDLYLARKQDPKSLNTLFYQKSEDTIILPQSKEISDKLISYLFGGRVQRIETMDQIKIIDGTIQKKELYIIKPKPLSPIFLLNSAPMKISSIILSYYFTPDKYWRILKVFANSGYKILQCQQLIDEEIHQLLLQNKDLKTFFAKEGLNNFHLTSSENSKKHSTNLYLKVLGPDTLPVREKILSQVLNYNPLVHTKKKEYFYSSSQLQNVQMLDKLISTISPSSFAQNFFTKTDIFTYFIIIYPFLGHSNNLKQIDLKFFNTLPNMELIAIKLFDKKSTFSLDMKEKQKDFISVLLLDQLVQNKQTKRNTLSEQFCQRISQLLTQDDYLIACFRYQDNFQTKSEQFFTSLSQQSSFIHSNYSITEQQIKFYNQHIAKGIEEQPDFLDVMIFRSKCDTIMDMGKVFSFHLVDDTQLSSSFIFDVNDSNSNQDKYQTSQIIIGKDTTNFFGISWIIKYLELAQLQILSIVELNLSNEIVELISKSLSEQCKLSENILNSEGFMQLLPQKLDYMVEKLMKESVLTIVVKHENAIFLSKKILQELAIKLIQLKKQKNKSENQETTLLFEMENIMYAATNIQFSNQLSSLLNEVILQKQNYAAQVFVMNSAQIQQSNLSKINKQNLMALLVRADSYILEMSIYELVHRLAELKFRVENVCLTKIQNGQIQEQLSKLFTPKFDAIQLTNYFHKPEIQEALFLVFILNTQNISCLSDQMGTFKFDQKGEITNLISGNLFNKSTVFRIYTEKIENVQQIQLLFFEKDSDQK